MVFNCFSWVYSPVVSSDDGKFATWNLTGTPKKGNFTLKFVCHVEDGKTQIKFDTNIVGFANDWEPEAKYLVLAYRLTSKSDLETKTRAIDRNRLTFDNGFLDVATTANDGHRHVSIELDTDDDAANQYTLFVIYEKFGDELDHDPTLGIEVSDNLIMFIIGGVVVGVVALLFAGFIVFGFLAHFIIRHREQQFHEVR